MRKFIASLVCAAALLSGTAFAQNTIPYEAGTGGLTSGIIPKAGATAGQLSSSGLSDNGTTITTTNENLDVGGASAAYEITNDTTTGTTTGKLAKLTAGGKAIIAGTTDTSGVLGVVLSGGATSGSAAIVGFGVVACTFDNTSVQGDYVIASTSAGGDCHDAGSTSPAVQVIGRVLTAGTGSQNILALAGGSGGINSGHVNFTTTGANSWTPPTNYSWVYVEMIGGGGGGGGGSWQTASTACSGGAGGGSGGWRTGIFSAAQVGSSAVTVNVGVGGTAGAAAITGAGHTGGNGGVGGDSSFGTFLTAYAGGGGGGGTISTSGASAGGAAGIAGDGGTNGGGPGAFNSWSSSLIPIPGIGIPGGNGSGTSSTPNTPSAAYFGPGSGSAGGGASATNVFASGATGGPNVMSTSGVTGGAAGATGGNGNPGTNGPTDGVLLGGSGGSGGGGGNTTQAGTGGAGGVPGGGGGGGGCLISTGTTTAPGGAGARGEVRLWWG